jgi:predicted HNH restriction endonuclease
MIYFNCPYCLADFHEDVLFEQEEPLIDFENGRKTLPVLCHNCHEPFHVHRSVAIQFEVVIPGHE